MNILEIHPNEFSVNRDSRGSNLSSEVLVVSFDNLINLTSISNKLKMFSQIDVFNININRFYSYVLAEVIPHFALGTVVNFHMEDNDLLATHGLRSLIYEKYPQLSFVENQKKSKQFQVTFKVSSIKNRHIHTGWTFGLLCKYSSPSYIANFIDSCVETAKYNGEHNFEIIIYMGDNRSYDFGVASGLVRVIGNQNPNDSNISRKKNDICSAANYSDIVISHDRYILGSNFCYQYEKSGYRLDLSVPTIIQKNGSRALDWGVINSRNLSWSDGGILNYRDNNPYSYVAGGFTVIRKEAWMIEKWNESLHWNDHEDVDLSRRYQASGLRQGVVPATVVTLKDRWINQNTVVDFDDQNTLLPGIPRSELKIKYV